MGFAHITADQKRHAFRQRLAGVAAKQIQRNQRHLFGSLAPTMSVRSIRRAHTAGLKGNAAPPCRRFVPGRSLTARHNRWLRAQLAACSQRSTTELSASLGEQEVGFSPRQTFAHSTIDDFVREGEGNTVKVLTVYDPRLDLAESARCRAALKRYPAKCLVVIDASHVDTRLDSARRHTASIPSPNREWGRDGGAAAIAGINKHRGCVVFIHDAAAGLGGTAETVALPPQQPPTSPSALP